MSRVTEHRPARRRGSLRVAAGLTLGAATVLVGATAASAHVHVQGINATQGGEGVITFQVPSESETASTTGLTVTFPTNTPFVEADTQPMTGWKETVTTAKLAKPITTDDGQVSAYVTTVSWTATTKEAQVPPGHFQEFDVSVGPFPKKAEVAFPALQTYSDGTSVNWNETATGSAEPEHPAPVLELAKVTSAAASGSASTTTTASSAASSSDAGMATGIIGIVVGVVGIVIALIALLRGRRQPGATN